MPFSPDQLSELAQLKAADPERPTVVELFRFAAQIALVCICRLFEIIVPVQRACPALARRWMRLYTLHLRLMLTLRFAPERFNPTQLRQLAKARHILEFFLNRPIPHLSPSPSPSPSHSEMESPSPSPSPSQSISPSNPQSAIYNQQSQSDNPRSPRLAPYIPDQATLAAALKSETLPPSCAAALLENPGDAYARMLVQLDKLFRTIFQPSTQSPSPSHSEMESPSPSQSQSISPSNLQSSICNQQSDNPQSPSVHPVHPVHPVHSVHDVHHVHLAHPAPP